MSFDYDTIRTTKPDGGSHWASYSDLFMVLAFIFLLLYMVANLRTGMISVSSHAQITEVRKELAVIQSVKSQYLAEESNDSERKVYDRILDQIYLLETEAEANKKRLAKEFNEQKRRESSLNQYQQMIVAMIDANAIAKAEAVKKITSEQQEKDRLAREIDQINLDVAMLAENLERESAAKTTLVEETRNLKGKIRQMTSAQGEKQTQLASLEDLLKAKVLEKAQLQNQLAQKTKTLQGKIQELQGQQDESQNKVAALELQLEQEAANKLALQNELAGEAKTLQAKLRKLSERHDASQAELRALGIALNKEAAEKDASQNASAAEIKALENKFTGLQGEYRQKEKELGILEGKLKSGTDKIEELEKAHSDNVAELGNRIDELKTSYAGKRGEADKLNSDLGNAQRDLSETADRLHAAEEKLAETSVKLANAVKQARRRKDMAEHIRENFKKDGINADVDSITGDVILDFGSDYFADNSDDLKGGMEGTLRKAIPVYAQSLFGNKQLAKQIASVEIIGFASPTYGGRPVDPTSLSSKDRAAVNYNLDLSYRRARSIFDYVFDTTNMKFNYQSTMLPLIKVTGRSFFSEEIKAGDPGKLSIDEFCGQYNCSKSQRVIIRFGLSEYGVEK